MMRVVYHGSYTKIDQIDLSQCHKGRDFGQGFYVTNIRSQAASWAIRKGGWRNTQGEVTEFGLHEELVQTLKLKVLKFDGYSGEWLDFVVSNRLNDSDKQVHDYDLVEGPIADDDIANRVGAYIGQKVSKEQFLEEVKHKSPTHQICFCTERSLNVLITQRMKINNVFAHTDNDIVQSLMTDFGKSEAEAMDFYYTSRTYTKLADESSGLYLKPWPEIYEMLKQELE
jgi:hypothetical protein